MDNESNFKVFIDKERCKGCFLCAMSCPMNILSMSKNTNSQSINYSVINDNSKCIGCLSCADICPELAIQVAKKEK